VEAIFVDCGDTAVAEDFSAGNYGADHVAAGG
jgi:hypothetical protein